MRVHTIELANLCVGSDVMDSDGGFLWIVRVTERSPAHRLVLEKGGSCGRGPRATHRTSRRIGRAT